MTTNDDGLDAGPAELVNKLAGKFLSGEDREWWRAIRHRSYRELIAIVAKHNPEQPAISFAASSGAVAKIGALIGATRFEWGVPARDLRDIIFDRPQPYHVCGSRPDWALFDHCRTFFAGKRALAILARPYVDYDGAAASVVQFSARMDIPVWGLPTELCSWYPGRTQTFLITRRYARRPAPAFELVPPDADVLIPPNVRIPTELREMLGRMDLRGAQM